MADIRPHAPPLPPPPKHDMVEGEITGFLKYLYYFIFGLLILMGILLLVSAIYFGYLAITG